MSRPNILVLYGCLAYPLRATVRDLVFSFRKYAEANCFYYSPDHGEFPDYLKKTNFDLIVFTTVFMSERWGGRQYLKEEFLDKVDFLKQSKAIKVVHPQDEWIHTDTLCEFINDFGISHVFSVAPPSEWKKIYDKVDHSKVKFHLALTGYLDHDTVKKIDTIVAQTPKRDIDVGYRAFRAPAWLGSHGFLKTTIAEVFSEKGPKEGFTVDISTDQSGVILGDDWFRFMARCRYFIGVEGGSAILDPDGSIWKKGEKYEKEHPHATFEEFEKNCFPGMDGNLKLIAISPRHLESCATKTCQVLVEGEYNGILKPGLHYIELKADFSNLPEVFAKMKDENLRKTTAERAYTDIVASDLYSYRNYVKQIIESSLEGITLPAHGLGARFNSSYDRLREYVYWKNRDPKTIKKIEFCRGILINIYIYLGFRKLKALIFKRG